MAGQEELPSPGDGAVPHAFVADLAEPVLDHADRHHLARVLRLRPGDLLTVADGAGAWRPCRFGDELEPLGEVQLEPVVPPELTVAFALVKGERPELVVQKLTELGIDRIVPFRAARSVVQWDEERSARHHDRLQKVAREAAVQCRRCRLPVVDPVASFADVVALPGAAAAERGGHAPSLDRPTLLVGPEGGWAPEERERLPAVVALGPHVLRAETAAIAGGAVLAALRAAGSGPR